MFMCHSLHILEKSLNDNWKITEKQQKDENPHTVTLPEVNTAIVFFI